MKRFAIPFAAAIVSLALCSAVLAFERNAVSNEDHDMSVVGGGPELRWAGSAGALNLGGWLQNKDSGEWIFEPRLEAMARETIRGDLSGSLSLDAGTRRWPGIGNTAFVQTTGGLVFGKARRAAWIGAGAARLRRGGEWSTSGIYHGGATIQVGRTRLSLITQASSYSNAFTLVDTVFTPGDSLPPFPVFTSGTSRHAYANTGVELAWQGDRLGLGLDLNLRLGERLSEPRASAVLSGNYRVLPRLTLIVQGGRNPSVPDQAIPSHHFANMTFQVDLQKAREKSFPVHGVVDEPVSPSFAVQPLGARRARIRMRYPDAGSIEIAGDFSDWTPLPLRRSGFDTWTVECTMGPGSHRTNIRVDGGPWVVPPGLESLEDEFSGRVGVFVMK